MLSTSHCNSHSDIYYNHACNIPMITDPGYSLCVSSWNCCTAAICQQYLYLLFCTFRVIYYNRLAFHHVLTSHWREANGSIGNQHHFIQSWDCGDQCPMSSPVNPVKGTSLHITLFIYKRIVNLFIKCKFLQLLL